MWSNNHQATILAVLISQLYDQSLPNLHCVTALCHFSNFTFSIQLNCSMQHNRQVSSNQPSLLDGQSSHKISFGIIWTGSTEQLLFLMLNRVTAWTGTQHELLPDKITHSPDPFFIQNDCRGKRCHNFYARHPTPVPKYGLGMYRTVNFTIRPEPDSMKFAG